MNWEILCVCLSVCLCLSGYTFPQRSKDPLQLDGNILWVVTHYMVYLLIIHVCTCANCVYIFALSNLWTDSCQIWCAHYGRAWAMFTLNVHVLRACMHVLIAHAFLRSLIVGRILSKIGGIIRTTGNHKLLFRFMHRVR
jgi:hypothetical protein